ncbi:MAG: cytochrome ubiquinol oxidase subunit I [Calditrichia bacterium]
MDAVLLSRIQFALTVGFHFLFPPLSIGLAWLLTMIEFRAWRKKDELYERMGRFWGKLLAISFVLGVATGIVMEFQFGTNWSEYSKFVGDIFGAPLAAEGVFAFFLESGFLGLYLFGRNRISKGLHWFSSLMVAVGSTLSAFWIIVANSWQQTPAGFVLQNGRAELTDFWAAVFNPSTVVRYLHTVDAAIITGAFFMAGISAYFLLKKRYTEEARASLRLAVIVGFIAAFLEIMPFGHEHAQQVAATQPEKFAAIEGIYTTEEGAAMVIFGIPDDQPPRLKMVFKIPGILSWLAFGDWNAPIKGINEFPEDERPPLKITFYSFHLMVALGVFFVFIMGLSVYQLYRKKLWDSPKILKTLLWSIPLPFLACQVGWIAAEVGRQPWIVYRLLRTRDAVSVTVPAWQILVSIIIFCIIYAFLFYMFIYLVKKEVNHGPVAGKEVSA